jgi:hypothetical protein
MALSWDAYAADVPEIWPDEYYTYEPKPPTLTQIQADGEYRWLMTQHYLQQLVDSAEATAHEWYCQQTAVLEQDYYAALFRVINLSHQTTTPR